MGLYPGGKDSVLKKFKSLEIPYLDEMIIGTDHFVIDRNKQVTLVKAMKHDYSIK